ncbi:MAG: ABC transporter ATP-binding protein [Patescibacteria group bacterium]
MEGSHDTIIKISGLKKDYILDGGRKAPVLLGLDLEIRATDFAIIYGPSGCGKSTLLHTIVGLEKPTDGSVKIRGTDIYKLKEEERAAFRAEKFGMVYQSPFWIKALTVWENVAMPLLIAGEKTSAAKNRAIKSLEEVGMAKYWSKRPMQLSGGEQQRVGLARALVNNPWIIVADEPTGNLDSHSSDEIMNLFQSLQVKSKRTVIMVSHNLIYLPMATKKIAMRDGVIAAGGESEIKKAIKEELKGVL